jgi:hypothetical protein
VEGNLISSRTPVDLPQFGNAMVAFLKKQTEEKPAR